MENSVCNEKRLSDIRIRLYTYLMVLQSARLLTFITSVILSIITLRFVKEANSINTILICWSYTLLLALFSTYELKYLRREANERFHKEISLILESTFCKRESNKPFLFIDSKMSARLSTMLNFAQVVYAAPDKLVRQGSSLNLYHSLNLSYSPVPYFYMRPEELTNLSIIGTITSTDKYHNKVLSGTLIVLKKSTELESKLFDEMYKSLKVLNAKKFELFPYNFILLPDKHLSLEVNRVRDTQQTAEFRRNYLKHKDELLHYLSQALDNYERGLKGEIQCSE